MDKDADDGKSVDRQSAAKEKERVDTAEVETTESNAKNEEEKEEKPEPRIETDETKVKERNEEAVEGAAEEKGDSVAAAETETKEEEFGGEEVRAMMENGLETDPEDHLTNLEIATKEAVKERATATNQSAEETQE